MYEKAAGENSSDNSEGSSVWKVGQNDTEIVNADSSSMQTLLAGLSSLSYKKMADYRGEDLEKYGLDDPVARITWNYTEQENSEISDAESKTQETETADSETENSQTVEQTVTLEVGFQVPEEECYYVKLADTQEIYLMSSDSLKSWLEASYTEYVDKRISPVPQTALKVLEITYQGKIYKLTVEAEVQEDQEKTVYRYCVNGAETDATNFLTFYGKAVGMKMQSVEGDAEVTGAPEIFLKFEKMDGTEITAAYYPGTDGMYRVQCSSGLCGKVSRLEITELLREFEELIG